MTTVSLDFTTADEFTLPKSFSWRDTHADGTLAASCVARTKRPYGDGSVRVRAGRPAEAR